MTNPSPSAAGQPGAEAGAQGAPPVPDRSWIEFNRGIRNQDPELIERKVIERGDQYGTGHITTPRSKIYGEFIEAELKAEKDRRDSVHTRAAAAVTSSAGLVTLVVAVFGFLVGKTGAFPNRAKWYFVAAVVLLLCAGACAVAAGFPTGRRFVSRGTLDRMLDSHRDDSEEVARDAVAYINLVGVLILRYGTTSSRFRWGTTMKAGLLSFSGIFQIVAMLLIGVCMGIVMHDMHEIVR